MTQEREGREERRPPETDEEREQERDEQSEPERDEERELETEEASPTAVATKLLVAECRLWGRSGAAGHHHFSQMTRPALATITLWSSNPSATRSSTPCSRAAASTLTS